MGIFVLSVSNPQFQMSRFLNITRYVYTVLLIIKALSSSLYPQKGLKMGEGKRMMKLILWNCSIFIYSLILNSLLLAAGMNTKCR